MGGNRRWGLCLVVAAMTGVLAVPGTAGQSGPRALFFGDSLFVGTGSSAGPVQARTAAQLLRWHPVVDAVGGTGFTTGGRHGQPYLTRLRRDGYLRRSFDVIVLEGGTNDAHHGNLALLRDRTLAVLDYVHRAQPRARVVLVGGFVAHGVPHRDQYAEVDRILADVAAERGLTFVSQLRYADVTTPGFLARDHFHPSAEGYRLMGRDLAIALRG
jgi:lysophospholipase L1-like esterase